MEPTENWDDSSETLKIEDEAKKDEDVQDTQVIIGFHTFDDYLKDAFDAIRGGIKAANNLPTGENFNYYACFPSFNKIRNEDSKKILEIMQKIMNVAGVTSNICRRDIEEKFDLLLEANDVFLDKASLCMDEECGILKNPEIELVVSQTKKHTPVTGSWNSISTANSKQLSDKTVNAQAVRLLTARNIQRPQITFKDKIDNSLKPWEPKIKDKPNSLKPLAIYLEETENGEVFCHPYECELDKFQPPENQLQKREPVKYKTLNETPLIMINKQEDIKILMNDLMRYQEIAVDLEHHSYRSFQGITCLMQISTYDTDYIIDTLALRSDLHELNEIFTKPTILKVFHGAESDIQWLQRDMSLYIVNMFDTHQAAKQLNLPYLSLAYLLKRFCGIDPNKHFQLADWRIRPLPEELLKYAREDTHYLLHIKDILKNALIDSSHGKTNILKAVYDRSTEICKLTYIKPIWTEESYMNMYRKSQKIFNNKQLYALRELHKWRDTTAREEDDSTGYVLPNHMLLNIAETLPREMQGILACCNPIPPLVRQNLLKLHKIILKAREQPLIKPVLENDLRQRFVQRNHIMNSEVWVYSPHDIPSGTEARADLPCLLDHSDIGRVQNSKMHVKHSITVFDSPHTSEDEESMLNKTEHDKKKRFLFISPFERYKRVIPVVAEQEEQDRQEKKVEQDRQEKKVEQGRKEKKEEQGKKEKKEEQGRKEKKEQDKKRKKEEKEERIEKPQQETKITTNDKPKNKNKSRKKKKQKLNA
ncbi:hypothetical protein KPH14_008020 [Odynerus spinipes]|uniref:Exosome complex component 10 homolog n=1 Tax=Odynerus spinipes TaxID=1348599 RepID=A0AAD9VPF9_9HYME|nr:hypothetical protein KPH14_008020 [Odynerus spinipes]